MNRDKVIIRTSVIGIITNVLLAGFKAAIGLITSSIAVILDAANNLSDALSSAITIVGTKLAGKLPDKKHPLGYGRIEYLSAMIVAAIILYTGITAGVESVKKIFSPEDPDHNTVSFIIIGTAVLVKVILGRYVSSVGKKVNSGSLTASGSDALFDAVLSASVFASALIFKFTGVNLEAYVGVIIAIFIVKAGVEMLLETLDEILGKRADPELIQTVKKTISSEEEVMGAYDLILHSYGPDKLIGSVHIEVSEKMTAPEIDLLERRISEKVYADHGIILAGIGIYSFNEQDNDIRSKVLDIALKHEGVLQIHGLYADHSAKTIRFDIIIDYELDNRKELYTQVTGEMTAAFPDWSVNVVLDIDI